MKFVDASPDTAASEITGSINNALREGSVLLLLSGGSNIQLAVKVRNKLEIQSKLCVGLIDERYGAPGHPDSNWTQLMEAGFNTDNIEQLPVITDDRPIEVASADYARKLQTAADVYDCIIGIFGIGIDGHTSGILPDSPAINETGLVTHFIGPDFPRITTTPAFMPLVDKAYLVSFGQAKYEQLARLRDDLSVSDQPAQSLKQISDLTVLTDYREGTE